MVSIIIPSYNEMYLDRTVESLHKSAGGEIEVIVVENKGQRAAVNEAVRKARSKYIMKIDAHTLMGKNFDTTLAADCEDDWTVVPRMYALDPKRWKPVREHKTDYMYLDWRARNQYWPSYEKRPVAQISIDDVMCCQGNCWFQTKDRFLKLGGLDEKHGQYGQLGVEVSCKAWLSGGKLVVNKNTWFAHWFREVGGFPYKITGYDIEMAKRYSRDLWLNNKWPLASRRLGWLVDKFSPVPSWGDLERRMVA